MAHGEDSAEKKYIFFTEVKRLKQTQQPSQNLIKDIRRRKAQNPAEKTPRTASKTSRKSEEPKAAEGNLRHPPTFQSHNGIS